jgi:hypothetical protein
VLTLPSLSRSSLSPAATRLIGALNPLVAGVAVKQEAIKTAGIDSRAIEKAATSAQTRVELFCCFFIDVFLWVSLSGNVCHSPASPGNSRRSSRKFFKRTEFLIRLRQPGFRLRARLRPDKTARQAADFASSQAAASQQSHLRNVSTDPRNAPQKEHGVRICRTPCLEPLNYPFSFSGTT